MWVRLGEINEIKIEKQENIETQWELKIDIERSGESVVDKEK